MRRIWKRRARIHLLVAGVACLALIGAGEAGAAKAIAVDCTANPNALTVAIGGAKKGATLNITGTCTGTFEIATNLTLAGTGGGATLDGQQAGTVLTIDSGTKVDVSKLTITNGASTASTAIGGIHNQGTLSLTMSNVLDNSAGVGATAFTFAIGGIYNDGGTLTLTQSHVNSNEGDVVMGFAFGGILNEGAMTITADSSVTGNIATASGLSGTRAARAGIENGGTLTITNSTVAGNTASGQNAVGGVVNVATGTLTLTSSIVVLNNAIAVDGAVGGLSNVGGQVTIGGDPSKSSVSSNGAQSTNGPAVGGISNRPNQGSGGSMQIANTIVTANTASGAPAGTMAGGISNEAPATITLTGNSSTPSVFGNSPTNCTGFTSPACAA